MTEDKVEYYIGLTKLIVKAVLIISVVVMVVWLLGTAVESTAQLVPTADEVNTWSWKVITLVCATMVSIAIFLK